MPWIGCTLKSMPAICWKKFEAGKNNLRNVCNAIMNCMLEGDAYMNEPAEADKVNSSLTVRYYCDNLSEAVRSSRQIRQQLACFTGLFFYTGMSAERDHACIYQLREASDLTGTKAQQGTEEQTANI
jgi:hypothetical protein